MPEPFQGDPFLSSRVRSYDIDGEAPFLTIRPMSSHVASKLSIAAVSLLMLIPIVLLVFYFSSTSATHPYDFFITHSLALSGLNPPTPAQPLRFPYSGMRRPSVALRGTPQDLVKLEALAQKQKAASEPGDSPETIGEPVEGTGERIRDYFPDAEDDEGSDSGSGSESGSDAESGAKKPRGRRSAIQWLSDAIDNGEFDEDEDEDEDEGGDDAEEDEQLEDGTGSEEGSESSESGSNDDGETEEPETQRKK